MLSCRSFKWLLFASVIAAVGVFGGEKKASSVVTPIAELKGHGPVDFAKEILPILRKNCLACHGHLKPKADLNLENPVTIRKGGESGLAVKPGKGAESPLIRICNGQDENSFMPPGKNNVGAVALSSEQLGLLKLWIDQGALGDANAGIEPLVWRALPPGLNPIVAVDVTQDGQLAACTRANQIFLYSIPAGQLLNRLADPELMKDGLGAAADRDYVQSLAFSPDGTVLASGGYRCVKLWRKQPLTERMAFNDPKFNPTPVKCLAFHAASHRLAKGMADGRVEVWDSDAGKIVWAIAAHTAPVNALVFSGDGTLLVSGSADRTIRVWSAANADNAGEIVNPVAVNALAFHNESRQIIVGGADNLLRVWRLPPHADYEALPAKEIKGATAAITALEFAADGKALYVAAADGSIVQMSIDGGIGRKFSHGAPVTALAIRGDTKRLVTAGGISVKLHNMENGQSLVEVKGDRAMIDARAIIERDIAFFKSEVEYNKTALQNAEKEQKAAVDALKKAVEAKTAAIKDAGVKDEAFKKALAEKDAAKQVADGPAAALKKVTEAKDAAIKSATDIAAETKAAYEKAATLKKAFDKSAEARTAAEKALNELQAKANGKDPAAKPSPDTLKAAEAKLESAKLAFERDMAMHVTAEKAAQELDAKAKVVNEAKANAEKMFNELTAKNTEATAKFKVVEKTFTDAEAANKSAMAAKDVAEHTFERAEIVLKKAEMDVTHFKAKLTEFEAAVKQDEGKLDGAKKAVADSEKPLRVLAMSPTNGLVAAAGDGGLVSIWGAESGRAGERFVVPQAAAPGAPGGISALKFLDENRLAIATNTGCIVWNTKPDWKLESTIGSYSDDSPFAGRVLALQFSADGKSLAIGGGIPSRTGEVKIWNVADGKFAREFKDAHSDTVFGLAFTADGKMLASCGADRMIRIFTLDDGKLFKTFEGHTHHVLSVSWKRDGRTLASSGADKTVKLWDMTTGEQRLNIENRFKKEVTSVHYLWGQANFLASGGDGSVRIMKDEKGDDFKQYGGGEKGFIQAAAITADGKTLITGGDTSLLYGYDGTDGKQLYVFEPPK